MVPVIQTQGFKQVKQNLQSYLDSSGLVLQQKYAPIPTHENLYSGKEGPIVHMALANAQREVGQKQMLLIFVHFGLIIPHVVLSFKFFQVWVLGYILNNLNRNRRFQVWPFRLMGDLHYKEIIAKIIFKYTVLSCFKQPRIILATWKIMLFLRS